MTEVDGKASGWRADYNGGSWVISSKSSEKKYLERKIIILISDVN